MIVRDGNIVVLLARRDLVAFLQLVAAGSGGAPVFGPDRRFAQSVLRLRRRGIKIVALPGTRRRSARQHTRYILASSQWAALPFVIVRDGD